MQEQAIFTEALEKQHPAEREEYLDRVCVNDPALRTRIARLLQRHQQADNFLEAPVDLQCLGFVEAIPERPGTIIGPYKLLEQIGEGGFGLVFTAEQQHPVRRKVAIKVLKPGMDTRHVIARFEAERQALALMDHENIAKVLEAGETSSGRPFFAMELVRGVSITDYCDQNNLGTRQRLELFVTVCEAVQHAHHKGIIHRDIKPSNVLVTLHDGTPVVKVIDFGIAKALGQQLTDKTLHTGFAQFVGTPLYMSPEQAEMSGLEVDTRSDIFSLGVLLYELLTGTTPFDKERLQKAGYDEIRRILREEEPARPSTRVNTMGQAATTVSARRQSDPKRLSQMFRGELDWIVMKSMEKDRRRRYDSAGSLAADVQRHLRGEPVSAHPPSTWYRFGKLARRNKTGLIAAALVGLALLAGAAASLWQAIRATDAMHSERQARVDLDGQLGRTQEAEARATRMFEKAQAAEKAATRRLYDSLLAQARASRFSRRIGQRFQSLDAVAETVKIARNLNILEERTFELRNEAIACLALPDVRIFKEWDGNPAGAYLGVDFDSKFERYARVDLKGQVSIRRVADDQEIHSWSVPPGESWARMSRDGRFVAVGNLSFRKLWRLSQAQPELIVEESGSFDLDEFSPDSRLYAMIHPDETIGIYRLASGQLLRRLELKSLCNHVAFHPQNSLLAMATQGAIQICDCPSGKVVARLLQPQTNFEWLAWHPQGKILAAVGLNDHSIYLWDVPQGKLIGKLEGIKHGGIHIAFNHAGDLLASNGWEGKLRLWDWRTGQQLFSTDGPGGNRFRADDQLLSAGVSGKKVRIWEINAGREYRTLMRDPALGPPRYVELAVDPTGRLLAAAMQDGVGFWNLHTGQQLHFCPLKESTHSAVFEQTGALLTYGPSGLLHWPSATILKGRANSPAICLGPVQMLPVQPAIFRMASSKDGHVIACAQDWGAYVLNRDRPNAPAKLEHANARHLAVSPDGQWIATGGFGSPGGAKVWSAATAELIKDLPTGDFCIPAFSPDGKWLATTSWPGEVRLWSVGFWTQAKPTVPANFALPGVQSVLVFSPDSTLLAVSSAGGRIRLIDVKTGREFAHLDDPNQHNTAAFAFSPDGTLLIAGSEHDQSLHVWDLATIRRHLAEMGLDWDLPRYPPRAPRDPDFQLEVDDLSWQTKGAAYVELRQWAKAAAAYDKALELEPDNTVHWLEGACLHLQSGDAEGYQKYCVRMLECIGKSSERVHLGRLAHTWALGPQALADVKQARQVFELWLAMPPSGPFEIHLQGLFRYRAGDNDQAVACLEKGLTDHADWRHNVLNELVLAMAHHQLQHAAEARQWLDKAQQSIAQANRTRPKTGDRFAPPGWFWRDWVVVDLFLREAQALLGDKKK